MVLNHSTIISNRHTTYAIIFPETSLKARAYIRAGKQLLTKIEKPDATYSKAPIASVGQQRKDQARSKVFTKTFFTNRWTRTRGYLCTSIMKMQIFTQIACLKRSTGIYLHFIPELKYRLLKNYHVDISFQIAIT